MRCSNELVSGQVDDDEKQVIKFCLLALHRSFCIITNRTPLGDPEISVVHSDDLSIIEES